MNSPSAPKLRKVRRASSLTGNYRMQKNSMQPEILLIEDSSGLFTKIGAMLQNRGFQVTLAPDADSALEKVLNNNFAAIIVGASRDQLAGLDILAAVKEKSAEIKTMVVTSLVKPELPVKAYEIEIDDYIHWPLSSAELSSRLIDLLTPDGGGGTNALAHPDHEAHNKLALTAMGSLVEGFTSSLSMISQSLEDIRQDHLKNMEESLSEELNGMASQIQKLSDNMRRCWQLGGAAEPVTMAKEQRFH